jgi:hypothetical protein
MSTTACRAPLVLPHDPATRFALLQTMVGSYIRLNSGDFAIEGTLVTVVRPAMFSEAPNPIVILDVNGERIAGPVLPGDVLA